jgi:hypothetical protein
MSVEIAREGVLLDALLLDPADRALVASIDCDS